MCDVSQSALRLSYDYRLNMSYTDLFGDSVDALDSYIFNADGVLCAIVSSGQSEVLGNGWKHRVELDPGKYSVVTWAGNGDYADHYAVAHSNESQQSPFAGGVEIGKTTIDDLRIFLLATQFADNSDKASPDTAQFDDLFYGSISDAEVKPQVTTDVKIPLVKDTNTIRLKIVGISKLRSLQDIGRELTAEDFDIRITGRNGHYKSDNLVGEYARQIIYLPHNAAVADNTLTADVKVLRLMKGTADDAYPASLTMDITCEPLDRIIRENMDIVETIFESKIDARDSQGNIRTDSEGNPIKVYPDPDYLDRQDLFEITLVLELDPVYDLVVSVYINGWKLSGIYPVMPPH